MQVGAFDQNGALAAHRQNQRRHLHSVIAICLHEAIGLGDGLAALHEQDAVFKR